MSGFFIFYKYKTGQMNVINSQNCYVKFKYMEDRSNGKIITRSGSCELN